jgi:hypothetical protein
VLPDDDMRCAIETCRNSEKCFRVNNFRLTYDIQLVHLLVCNTQRIFKMHGATINMIVLAYTAVAVSCKTVCVHQPKVYEGDHKNLEYFDLKVRDHQLKRFSSSPT